MNIRAFLMIMALTTIGSGCRTDKGTEALREGLKQLDFPEGSVVQYAEAPRGTQFVPGQAMGVTNVISFQQEGYVVFIDEEPKYDWAHSFQLAFIPATSGKPDVVFRGSAIPDFSFRKPDGSTITTWTEY